MTVDYEGKTLFIIKPDAMASNASDGILDMLRTKFKIIALKTMRLTQQQAEFLYAEHKDRSYFYNLIAFTTSGPVMAGVIVCRPDPSLDTVDEAKALIGPTDPSKGVPGQIRWRYGTHPKEGEKSGPCNAIHTSATWHDAEREIKFFFAECELI